MELAMKQWMFKIIIKRGIKPDIFNYIYHPFVWIWKDGKDKSALKVFKEMRIAGYETNICAFNALRRMVAVETKNQSNNFFCHTIYHSKS